MAPNRRKLLFNVLRIALCLGALWIVIQGVTVYDHVSLVDGSTVVGTVESTSPAVVVRLTSGGSRDIAPDEVTKDDGGEPDIRYGLLSTWRQSRTNLLLAATIVYFVVVFLQALRFQWVLATQNIKLSYWQSCQLSIAGNFLNFATPLGSNAGDVFKAYFVSLHTERKTEAVIMVVLDRVIGLGTLLAVAAIIVLFAPQGSRLTQLRPYLLGMFGLLVVGAAVYLSPFLRRHVGVRAWLEKLPMVHHLKRMDVAIRGLAANKSILIGAILLTVGLQAIAVLSYFMVAVALAFKAGLSNFFEFYAYFATGVVVAALPGPPQGLGTVELAYRFLFQAFGTPSQIVVMALAIRLVMLVCSLPGLLVTLTGSYKPRDVRPIDPRPSAKNPPKAHLPDTSKT